LEIAEFLNELNVALGVIDIRFFTFLWLQMKKATDFKISGFFTIGGPTRTRTNLYLQTCTNSEHPSPSRAPNRPDSGHPLHVQSTLSVQCWTLSDRPEQTKRPDSGRSDTGHSTLTVQFLDALLGSNCVVF
jgi:hypothetical protein